MDKINEILSAISGLYAYNDEMAYEYMALIHAAVDEIDALETQPTSIADNVKVQTVAELRNELANRMNENTFFSSPIERRKSEFKISKALVVVAIGNVVHSMSVR